MGLLDTIEKIQQKPEHTRRQIMYVMLGVCMAIVFAIWAVNFSASLKATNAPANVATVQTSPLDYIKNVWNDITKR